MVVMGAIRETIGTIDSASAEVADAVDHQRGAITDISSNTQRASGSARSVSADLQALHAAFAQVGAASDDIRGKIGALGEGARTLKSQTELFLCEVLAA